MSPFSSEENLSATPPPFAAVLPPPVVTLKKSFISFLSTLAEHKRSLTPPGMRIVAASASYVVEWREKENTEPRPKVSDRDSVPYCDPGRWASCCRTVMAGDMTMLLGSINSLVAWGSCGLGRRQMTMEQERGGEARRGAKVGQAVGPSGGPAERARRWAGGDQ